MQPLSIERDVRRNGIRMVVNDMGERRHHVGRQAKAVEDSFALYSDETMEAEDKAFLLKLRDTTMAAIDESRFSQVVGRLQESMAVPITGKVQDVVQLTAQSYGINTPPLLAHPFPHLQDFPYLPAPWKHISYQTNCPQSRLCKTALLWGQFYALRGMGGALLSVRPRI